MADASRTVDRFSERKGAVKIADGASNRWVLVRQIAALEEVLADSYHSADQETSLCWVESTRSLLAEKRAALQAA